MSIKEEIYKNVMDSLADAEGPFISKDEYMELMCKIADECLQRMMNCIETQD